MALEGGDWAFGLNLAELSDNFGIDDQFTRLISSVRDKLTSHATMNYHQLNSLRDRVDKAVAGVTLFLDESQPDKSGEARNSELKVLRDSFSELQTDLQRFLDTSGPVDDGSDVTWQPDKWQRHDNVIAKLRSEVWWLSGRLNRIEEFVGLRKRVD